MIGIGSAPRNSGGLGGGDEHQNSKRLDTVIFRLESSWWVVFNPPAVLHMGHKSTPTPKSEKARAPKIPKKFGRTSLRPIGPT